MTLTEELYKESSRLRATESHHEGIEGGRIRRDIRTGVLKGESSQGPKNKVRLLSLQGHCREKLCKFCLV